MRLCVFCGSNNGRSPAYRLAAIALGESLARNSIGLVYGGAHVGLMGAVADAALAMGGEVIGVIPRSLVEREVAHRELADLRIVTSMHERKALMADLSDGFIALPGGIGTLEELFEIWTWRQLEIHTKPCGLLNTDGFYDGLSLFLDRVVGDLFLSAHHREILMVEQYPEAIIANMKMKIGRE